MGTQIKDILSIKEISFDDLKGKTLAIDSCNLLYQFLTTIRSRDGSLLTDSKSRPTSHLVGLFSRITNLMEKGIKMIFVFDGKAPKLKEAERERRKDLKLGAQKQFETAAEEGDEEAMKKYAARTSRLTKEMIDEAKALLDALGLPVIQAPSEGEAQAALIVKKGDADFCVSQDFDSLLFSAPRLLRNISIVGKRKKSGLSYASVKPELIDLSENLNLLGIDQEQLIALSILVGTDYNNGGVKGIGPKNALKLVKKHKKDFSSLFAEAGWDRSFSWQEVFSIFTEMPVSHDYKIEFRNLNPEKVSEILVKDHDFSQERVDTTLAKLIKSHGPKEQKGLGDYF